MQLYDRREFLASASLAGAASFLGRRECFAQEAPPETTTVRIPTGTLICNAPTYIADELLRAEGFTDIQHVPLTPERAGPEFMERTGLDFAMVYTPPMVTAIDTGAAATVLAGVHVGCNSLFAHEDIRSIRDLKGKKVGGGLVRQPLIASMAAYVGLDPAKDIEWVSSSFATAKELFVERKIDAFLALPPDPQDLRARKIGHVIVDSALDRPWSQHFCHRHQGVRSQTSGGDQACVARNPQGDRFLRQQSGGGRAAAGRWRLHGELRLCAADAERGLVQQVA